MAASRLRLAALLALFPAAAAGEGAPRGSGPLGAHAALVEASFRLSRMDYAEYGTRGTLLDGETGLVPNLALAFQVQAGPVSLRGAAAFGSAALDYTGLVQSANASTNGLEVASRSDARLSEVDGQVAVAFSRARGLAIVAGAARRRWKREIRDTTVVSRSGATVPVRGLSERYAWGEAHAGLRFPLLRSPAAEWEVEARVTGTLDPGVWVDWSGRWVELPLATRTGFWGGTALRAALGPVLSLRVAVALERFEFGASARDPVTGLVEPRSRTWKGALDVGVGARL